MTIFINTCVPPRCRMEEVQKYKDRYGDQVGFEILSMFDLPDFEGNLRDNLDRFSDCSCLIHGPVWEAEHSAPKGTDLYESTMYHVNLTAKFAKDLQPETYVYHLNNCKVDPGQKEFMLNTALENMQEIQELFPMAQILVENTGIQDHGDQLLNEQEFIDFCIQNNLWVILDLGHAGANGWDIFAVIDALKDRIVEYHMHNNDGKADLHNRIRDGVLDYEKILPYIKEKTPNARWVIEYTREEYDGQPLMEDIDWILKQM